MPPKGNKSCGPGCLPAVIYAIMAGAGIVLSVMERPEMLRHPNGLVHLGFHILFAAFWTWFMNWLCSVCYKGVAWVILLAPFFIGLVLLYYIVRNGNGIIVFRP